LKGEFDVREAFELASLLSSRLCHDLVSPVGAVTNGLEVLADETEADMRESAMRLITESADRAARKLQFARLAYGAGGGPQAIIDMGDARKITTAMLNDIKVALEWKCDFATCDRMLAKMLVNSAFLAAESLPRGGTVIAAMREQAGSTIIEVQAEGPMMKPMDQLHEIISGTVELGGLAPRAAQAYYTGLISRCLEGNMLLTVSDKTLIIRDSFRP